MPDTIRLSAIVLLISSLLGCDSGGPSRSIAFAEIENLGGWLRVDRNSPGMPVIEVYFGDTEVTDDALVHLKELKSLQRLDVRGTQVTDEGVNTFKTAIPNYRINR